MFRTKALVFWMKTWMVTLNLTLELFFRVISRSTFFQMGTPIFDTANRKNGKFYIQVNMKVIWPDELQGHSKSFKLEQCLYGWSAKKWNFLLIFAKSQKLFRFTNLCKFLSFANFCKLLQTLFFQNFTSTLLNLAKFGSFTSLQKFAKFKNLRNFGNCSVSQIMQKFNKFWNFANFCKLSQICDTAKFC